MKRISICIPCFNEEENIIPMYEKLQEVILNYRNKYDFEFIFADNASTDQSQKILRELAHKDKSVKVIFNTRNFGPVASNRNSILSATGDAVITIVCDFQDPPEMIPQFIEIWEKGTYVVCGQKTKSKENKIKYILRKIYYKIIKKMSNIPQHEQVTGFALYDRKVVEDIRKFGNPNIALRYVLAHIGYPIRLIQYTQPKRKNGKSSYNLSRSLDFAITSLINTSFYPARFMTMTGFFVSFLSIISGLVYLIYKLTHWNTFAAGMAPLLIGFFFVGAVILFGLGILGEYIASLIKQLNYYPGVFELERINFDDKENVDDEVTINEKK